MIECQADRDWQLPPVGLLALCPLIAAGNSVVTATCIALMFLILLTLVSGTMAVLGRSVSSELRILALLLISGIWVTLLDLTLQAVAFPLWTALGVYVPLIAANSLLLAVGEQSLRSGTGGQYLRTGLRLGGYAALWIIPMGLLREVVATGSLLSDSHLLPGLPGHVTITSFSIPLLQSTTGALLVLGLAAAWIAHRSARGALAPGPVCGA